MCLRELDTELPGVLDTIVVVRNHPDKLRVMQDSEEVPVSVSAVTVFLHLFYEPKKIALIIRDIG
jgi:hypothetical protein